MTESSADFAVNECVNYLSERNPGIIGNLKSRFPVFAHLLEPGMMMGADEDAAAQREKAVFVANLVSAALTEADGDVSRKLDVARRAIRRADGYQSATQVVALVLSGATLGLIGLAQPFAAQLTTLGAVAGSLLGLASDRILVVIDPSTGSYRSIFLKLVGLREKVNALRREALVHTKFPGSNQILSELSGQANAVCLEIRELGAQIL